MTSPLVIILKKYLFLIISFSLIILTKQSNLKITNYNMFYQNFSKRLLPNVCDRKVCIACENKNECIKCQEGYTLINHKCYLTKCKIYGFCKICDEFDCLNCERGYKLSNGLCLEHSNKLTEKPLFFILGGGGLLLLFFLIICICCCCKKKKNYYKSSEINKLVSIKRPKAGNYVLFFPEEKDNNNNNKNIPLSNRETETAMNNNESKNNMDNINDSNAKLSNKNHNMFSEGSGGKLKEEEKRKRCVICGEENCELFADCGCGLCNKHFNSIITEKETYYCRVHNVNITKQIKIYFNKTSNSKKSAVDTLGLGICPVCNIAKGTESFNCKCGTKLCEKCFNDNIFVLKYNSCPGCGEPYKPLQKEKTKSKSKSLKKEKKNLDNDKINDNNDLNNEKENKKGDSDNNNNNN